jgi:hypothetical protein
MLDKEGTGFANYILHAKGEVNPQVEVEGGAVSYVRDVDDSFNCLPSSTRASILIPPLQEDLLLHTVPSKGGDILCFNQSVVAI